MYHICASFQIVTPTHIVAMYNFVKGYRKHTRFLKSTLKKTTTNFN